jgi:hypothetical protein
VNTTPEYDRALAAINVLDEEDLHQIKLDVQARIDKDDEDEDEDTGHLNDDWSQTYNTES